MLIAGDSGFARYNWHVLDANDLRVISTSAGPELVGRKIDAPVFMIAEEAADLVGS